MAGSSRFIGLRTWLDAGVVTAINTDHMFGLDPDNAMNPFNPFLTMATAVSRRTEGGQVIGQAQRISRMEALQADDQRRRAAQFRRGAHRRPSRWASWAIWRFCRPTC